MNKNKTIDTFLYTIMEFCNAYTVALFLPQSKDRYLLYSHVSKGDLHLNIYEVEEKNSSLLNWLFKNKKNLLIDNFEQSPDSIGYYRNTNKLEIGSFFAHFLPNGSILCIDCTQKSIFTENVQKAIARAAQCLELIFEQLQEEDQEGEASKYFSVLEKLHSMHVNNYSWSNYLTSFLTILAQTTSFDYVSFASKNTEQFCTLEGENVNILLNKEKSLEIDLAGTMLAWVFRNESSVFHDGLDNTVASLYGKLLKNQQFKAVMCIPVISEKKICGVLCLANYEPKAFSDNLKSFIRLASDQLGLFLEGISIRYYLQSKSSAQSLNTQDNYPKSL